MNLQNRYLTLVIILAIFLFHRVNANESTQQPVTPTEHVNAVINEVLPYLQNAQLDRNTKWQKVRRVLHQHFDFRSLAQSALSRHWDIASREEQHQITVFFSQYLEVIYRASIESYTEQQRIEYLSEQVQGNEATVNIAITDDSGSIPVTFQLHNQRGRWMTYDVIIDGVSIIGNYKVTFNTILDADGMNGLMKEISKKIENYKAQYGTDIDAK